MPPKTRLKVGIASRFQSNQEAGPKDDREERADIAEKRKADAATNARNMRAESIA
jgi:hypothetical protein